VHTTLCVLPEVIVRLQDMLADHPEAKGWVEKPGDFPAEASTPEVSPPESAATLVEHLEAPSSARP
jgi:hypothetical protein